MGGWRNCLRVSADSPVFVRQDSVRTHRLQKPLVLRCASERFFASIFVFQGEIIPVGLSVVFSQAGTNATQLGKLRRPDALILLFPCSTTNSLWKCLWALTHSKLCPVRCNKFHFLLSKRTKLGLGPHEGRAHSIKHAPSWCWWMNSWRVFSH